MIMELARTLKFVFCRILLGKIYVHINTGGSLMSAVVRKGGSLEAASPRGVGSSLLFFSPVSTNASQLSWFLFHLVLLSSCVIFIS